jgi:hypothetical protein
VPFNGSNGTFTRLYNFVADAAAGIKILAARMDGEFNGIAAGLSNCVTRDGQSPPTANLPMGGKQINNLANGTASGDAINLGQANGLYLPLAGGTLTGGLTGTTGSFSGSLSGATGSFTGNVTAAAFQTAGASVGSSVLGGGGATTTGFVSFRNASNAQIAFIGANAFASALEYNAPASHTFTGAGVSVLSLASSGTITRGGFTVWDGGNFDPTLKANLASPTFTGTPASPTASPGTNTTQIATTAYVQTAISGLASLSGASFTGTVAVNAATGTSNGPLRVQNTSGNPSLDVLGSGGTTYGQLGLSTPSGSANFRVVAVNNLELFANGAARQTISGTDGSSTFATGGGNVIIGPNAASPTAYRTVALNGDLSSAGFAGMSVGNSDTTLYIQATTSGKIVFRVGGTVVASIDASGNLKTLGSITASTTP